MSEEFYQRLRYLIKLCRMDKSLDGSTFKQGMLFGMRLFIRAYHMTYPEEPAEDAQLSIDELKELLEVK